ncbi:MAG: Ppx/GppA phosphatase family protein, partial [Rhodothermales bacterium]
RLLHYAGFIILRDMDTDPNTKQTARDRDDDPPRQNPIRVCVIDLGTNSFHALIVDAYPNRSFQVLDKIKERVYLGEHGLGRHLLTEDAVQRAVGALKRIRLLAEGWQVEEYLAYATSAIREAANGGDFVVHVRKQVGIDIHPISGRLEARLIYQGVRRAVALNEKTLIVDIGGGSTECIVGDAEAVDFAVSLKLGAARMTERFVTADPLPEKERKALRSHYRSELDAVFAAAREHGARHLVGSSGTMESLAEACRHRFGDVDRSVFQQAFSADDFLTVTSSIVGATRSERLQMDGIEEKRVDQIAAGALLANVLTGELDIASVLVSPSALREGMVVHFIEENYERLERLAPLGDVRRRQVFELAARFDFDEPHARHVAALALQLFDACRDVHGLGDRERELLEYAALLHDIGCSINRKKHHKHSRYLIRKADWHGFQPEEIAMMAMIARYHRRALPKKSHKVYRDLSDENKRVVRRLAAFLRLSEGLDRSHFRNVSRMDASVAGDRLSITVRTREDPQMELWGARRAADLFEQEFDRTVHVSAAWELRST